MTTQAPSRVTAASLDLRDLSQASYKATEQLTSILNATEVLYMYMYTTRSMYIYIQRYTCILRVGFVVL